MDNGEDVNSTSTNGYCTLSYERSVNVSFGHTTNGDNVRKILRTPTLWEFFIENRFGASVRYHCSVPMCKRSFSTLSFATTLEGHLKIHRFFVNYNQTFLATTGFLRSVRMKPNEQPQTESVWLYVHRLHLLAFRSQQFITTISRNLSSAAISIFLYHHDKA